VKIAGYSDEPGIFVKNLTMFEVSSRGYKPDGGSSPLLAAKETDVALASCNGGLNIACGKVMAAARFFSGLIDGVRIYNRAVKPYMEDGYDEGLTGKRSYWPIRILLGRNSTAEWDTRAAVCRPFQCWQRGWQGVRLGISDWGLRG